MDTQSKRIIDGTMQFLQDEGVFKIISSYKIKEIQIKLGQIALAGFMDAKNASVDGAEQLYTELSKTLFK